jgi:hypothetical protein
MMLAPVDPHPAVDALVVVVDQDAEPLDIDRFLDALDRIVERRLSQQTEASNEAA